MNDECDELYIDGGWDDEGFEDEYAEGAYTDNVGTGTFCSEGAEDDWLICGEGSRS